MLAHGVGERVARLHVVEHLGDRLAERLVLGLLGEDVQALHQGQARVDHRRELPGEDDDVARRDAGPEGERDLLRLLADRDRDQLLPVQVREDVVLAGELELAGLHVTARGGAGTKRKRRHGSRLPRIVRAIARHRLADRPQQLVRVRGALERLSASSSVISPFM